MVLLAGGEKLTPLILRAACTPRRGEDELLSLLCPSWGMCDGSSLTGEGRKGFIPALAGNMIGAAVHDHPLKVSPRQQPHQRKQVRFHSIPLLG